MVKKVVAGSQIAVFKGKKIRKVLHKNEWWFVITDIVAVLTDSVQPERLGDLMSRSKETLSGFRKILCFNLRKMKRIL